MNQGIQEPKSTPPEAEPALDGLKPSSPLKLILKIGLPVAVSAVLVAWIFHKIEDPRKVWDSMLGASLLPLAAIVPVALASHLLRAWRWRRFIGAPVSLFYSFTSVMIGYAVNDVLPRVGEVVRAVNMNRTTKVPIARLLATLLAERILDIIFLGLLIGLSFLIAGNRISEKYPDLALTTFIVMIALFGALLGLFVVASAPDLFCRLFVKVASPLHAGLARKVEKLIRQAAEGLAFLKQPFQAFLILVETAGIWALYLAGFLLGLSAFGILERIGYDGGTVSYSITCAGVIVPTVGAVGSYHECGRISLTQFFGIDNDLAVACITVIHAILFYLVGGIFGVLAWGVQGLVRRRTRASGDRP